MVCCFVKLVVDLQLTTKHSLIDYRIAGKFGGLYYNRQIKIHQNFLLTYIIRMAIPYQTAKFISLIFLQ